MDYTEYIASDADKMALILILDNVNSYLSNPVIQIGNEIGQFPQDVYDELLAKQAAAQDVFDDSEATQEDVDAVKGALEAIFKTFKESLIVIHPESEKKYYITYDGEEGKGINSLDENGEGKAFLNTFNEQKFKFEEVVEGDFVYYRIQSVRNGKYLYRDSNGYTTLWAEDVSSEGDNALFRIVATENLEKSSYVFIQIKVDGKHLGNDTGTGWWSDFILIRVLITQFIGK